MDIAKQSEWKRKRIVTLAAEKLKGLERTSPVRYLPIINFPDYRIGDDGTLWAFRWDRKEKGRWKPVKGTQVKGGYTRVHLHCRGKRNRMVLLHRLVLEVFKGPCPVGLESCHQDDDPNNNRLSNLRWDTRKNNMEDRKENRSAKGIHPWYNFPKRKQDICVH